MYRPWLWRKRYCDRYNYDKLKYFSKLGKNLEKDITNDTTISAYLRSQSIGSFLQEFYYVDQVVSSHPDVNFRYMIFPTKKLPEYPGVPLNFNKKDLMTMHSMGVDDAKAAINAGKGVGMKSYLSKIKEIFGS